jgi:hypothetical protein
MVMLATGSGADMSKFRYHTGATLRPLADDEPCPLLFRDLGPVGMALFVAGGLRRLAGPMAPILYLRSADYTEPYTDYEDIGRLVVLRPRVITPWFSGVPEIYVADASLAPMVECMAYVPTEWATMAGATALSDLPDPKAIREALGGPIHDERLADLCARLVRLNSEREASERLARPVRRVLQSGTLADRETLRRDMAQHGVSERDLCSAWHHIPREHREALNDWLRPRQTGMP